MKTRFASAIALCFAFAQFAAAPAMAYEPAAELRTAAPQSFSAEDLQRYGLSAEEVATVQSYQARGYVVMTPEEASRYTAGEVDGDTLLIVAGLVLVAIAIVAAD